MSDSDGGGFVALVTGGPLLGFLILLCLCCWCCDCCCFAKKTVIVNPGSEATTTIVNTTVMAPQGPGYSYLPPDPGHVNQFYAAQQPLYAPQQPLYAPQQPLYAHQQSLYAPQQPLYAHQQPLYAPQHQHQHQQHPGHPATGQYAGQGDHDDQMLLVDSLVERPPKGSQTGRYREDGASVHQPPPYPEDVASAPPPQYGELVKPPPYSTLQ